MKIKERNKVILLLLRYLILVLLGLGNLWLISVVVTPLTIGVVFILFKLFFDNVVLLSGSKLFVDNILVELIPACIGVAGYYLLLILNLAMPIDMGRRVRSIVFLLLGFFIFNVLRIIVFTFFFLRGYAFFDTAHALTWYLGSTLFVVVLWFVNIWIFKIKTIPFVDDVKRLRSLY